MKWVIQHDDDCPLGTNGQRAFDEAADALSNTPPEARATRADKFGLAQAWIMLIEKQHCTCGSDEARAEIIRMEIHAKSSAAPRI